MSDTSDNSQQGLRDLNTTQQSCVRYLGLIIQAIQNTFPNFVPAAPATATSAGTPGQVAFDATHFYVCIATNTWVRATLATF